MTKAAWGISLLQEAVERVAVPLIGDHIDYRIGDAIGPTYLARARSGALTVLIPLTSAPAVTGRRGGGFSLQPIERVAFDYGGRGWEQAAAVLECTDESVTAVFLVLVADLADRLQNCAGQITWQAVVGCVDEWQTLLAHRAAMTTEQQLGLWGELWLIANAADVDRLAAAWFGPDRNVMDFFLDRRGLDVKTSRQPNVHHIAHRQIDAPVGVHDAYLLSVWIGPDPQRGQSLSELVDVLLTKVSDPGSFLKRIANAGYVPVDRELYGARWIPLEVPGFFRADEVPRVRLVDPGVSQLRYVVTLDPDRALSEQPAQELWMHFCGRKPTIAHDSALLS